jgi:hypothetical protein
MLRSAMELGWRGNVYNGTDTALRVDIGALVE